MIGRLGLTGTSDTCMMKKKKRAGRAGSIACRREQGECLQTGGTATPVSL